MGLKDLRTKKGLSYHQLAKASGVNYQKIWQIEHGVIKPKNIALKTAIKLAKALDCHPEDLTQPDQGES